MCFVPGGAGPGCAAREPGFPGLGSALGLPCPVPLSPRCCHPPESRLPVCAALGCPVGDFGRRQPEPALGPAAAPPGRAPGRSAPRVPSSSLSAPGPGRRFALFQRSESPRWDHPNSLTPRAGCRSRSWLSALLRSAWLLIGAGFPESSLPSAAGGKSTRR
ncbi:unnamed protein product [Coccothraustes coccothraustes]